ncbi:MAG: transposase [Deltaproteobacteria bacterium]|nr:transposase [Deltaproteobacteria bacterium]
MASYPRYFIVSDHSTFHVTWQCHNHDWLLKENWAKSLYYSLLLKFKSKYGVKIHSYSFMDNHPHLTGTMRSKEKFSAFFRVVNSLFAKAINKRLKRRGQVVMDRFKSPRIETDRHLLEVMVYIDLNPFRVKKVKHPQDYRYSSYGYYAYGKEDALLDPPEIYLSLGKTPESRQKIYREMVESVISKDEQQKRNFSNTYFIGNPNWVFKKHKSLLHQRVFKRKPSYRL